MRTRALVAAGAVVLALGGGAALQRAKYAGAASAGRAATTSSPAGPRVAPPGADDREPGGAVGVVDALHAEPDAATRRGLVDAVKGHADPFAELRAISGADLPADTREQALIAAASLGGPEAVAFLAEIAARDVKLGARAGAALGTIADPRAAGALADLVTSDAPVVARANAARALGASGSAEQEKTLAGAVVRVSEALRVRQEAALSLARIGDAAVVSDLAGALDRAAADGSPESEQLRISIVQGLGGIHAAPAREALERHLGRSLSPGERAFTARALGAQKK
jgi:HEAT repeat protein